MTGNEADAILNHMVKHADAQLDATFAALSDPTRRGILAQLALGETSVSELAAPYEMSLPAVSKHLRVLQHAGLVTRRKNGRVHRCRLVAEPMQGAAQWIDYYRRFWEAQLDALEKFLDESMNVQADVPADVQDIVQGKVQGTVQGKVQRSPAAPSKRRRPKAQGTHTRNTRDGE